jgi:hypothetical protein
MEKKTTYRLIFDLGEMPYLAAMYATAHAAERLDLDIDAERTERRSGELVWVVDYAADTAEDAVAAVKAALRSDVPLVETEEL